MKNKSSKEKKISRNFIAATVCFGTLFLTLTGMIFYLLLPNIQRSYNTERRVSIIALIILLVTLFVQRFWHQKASKRYWGKYMPEDDLTDKGKMVFGNLAFITVMIVVILIALGVGLYFG